MFLYVLQQLFFPPVWCSFQNVLWVLNEMKLWPWHLHDREDQQAQLGRLCPSLDTSPVVSAGWDPAHSLSSKLWCKSHLLEGNRTTSGCTVSGLENATCLLPSLNTLCSISLELKSAMGTRKNYGAKVSLAMFCFADEEPWVLLRKRMTGITQQPEKKNRCRAQHSHFPYLNVSFISKPSPGPIHWAHYDILLIKWVLIYFHMVICFVNMFRCFYKESWHCCLAHLALTYCNLSANATASMNDYLNHVS